ncbi:unnamed protein product [Symbiodinium natans]|uniref:Uncharacterized protein n=1 Tax=Symbiodinium natans TaxID=878477 RepID=A0A812Q314_9DINO|nr:unnamed protein product [Symbiodinium natans]
MAASIKRAAQQHGCEATVHCVDISRQARVDLATSKVRNFYLQQLRDGLYDAVLLSPPCSSFSRAVWANFRGPRPVRSSLFPRGYKKLTAVERDKAILGTLFADFAGEVALLVAQGVATFLAFEQREDLGALKKGPHRGQRPASMWQWPQLHHALEKGLRTVAFHQASFGVPFPKPTRLLLKYNGPLPSFVFEGRPTFADDGSYEGPLPAPSEHRYLGDRAMLCRWLAEILVSTCSATAPPTTSSGRLQVPTKKDLSYVTNEPEGPRTVGGVGDPRTFRMATGGEEGCYTRSCMRQMWRTWLEKRGIRDEKLLTVTEGQPLYLRLLRALLEAAGDPDREFLLRAEEGLPVGILEPLPRTPHVCEEQSKWALENEPWEESQAWVPNYSSQKEHADFVRTKFDEDVEEGLMEKMTLGEFKRRYGEHQAIAVLAVIVEDEATGKKRVIHDATHGVRVNHRVLCRDKLRAPGAREKKQLLREFQASGIVAFSVAGDIQGLKGLRFHYCAPGSILV